AGGPPAVAGQDARDVRAVAVFIGGIPASGEVLLPDDAARAEVVAQVGVVRDARVHEGDGDSLAGAACARGRIGGQRRFPRIQEVARHIRNLDLVRLAPVAPRVP